MTKISINSSGLAPKGVAVLVKPYEPEFKASSIIIPETVGDRSKMIENRAIVIEVGPEAWRDEKVPRAKVGDKVIITRYAGVMSIGPLDNQIYRLVNDRDIFCEITAEATKAL